MNNIMAFLKDESGATAIEYGLIAAAISIAAIVALGKVGTALKGKFEAIETEIKKPAAN